MHFSNSSIGLEMALLQALCEAWLQTNTPAEIRTDIGKIQLLKIAARRFNNDAGELPGSVDQFYEAVFLRPFAAVAADPPASAGEKAKLVH